MAQTMVETTSLFETAHENTRNRSSLLVGPNSPEDAVNNRWFEEAAQAARRPSSLTGSGSGMVQASALIFGPKDEDPAQRIPFVGCSAVAPMPLY